MVDVFAIEETQVGVVDEGFPVVVLVGGPFGVHIPEHPLAAHLEYAATAPTLALTVAGYHRLERVAEFVGDAVQLLVFHTVGGNPQGANHSVVVATVGGAFERVVEHHHHAILVSI